MKRYTSVIFFFGFWFTSFSQSKEDNVSDGCKDFLKNVSYFWKLDSLGQNGYRVCVYNGFLKCKFDKITLTELYERLGKPNYVSKDNSGTYYCYYYYDGITLPKESGYTPDVGILKFMFEPNNPYLKSVGHGYLD